MRCAAIALCALLSGAAPLWAQDTPHFDVAGTYGFMHDADRSQNFPAGWAAAAAGNVNSWFGVVAEVGGGYTTCKSCQRGPFASQTLRGHDLHLRVHTYMGGPRVAVRGLSAVTPFAQVLFGGAHLSGGIEWDGALNTGFTYQPGAGVDVRVHPNLAIRLQGDYRVIRTTGANNKQSRLLTGVVYNFRSQ
jgi:opacity protein-like surface antigen